MFQNGLDRKDVIFVIVCCKIRVTSIFVNWYCSHTCQNKLSYWVIKSGFLTCGEANKAMGANSGVQSVQ